MVTIATESLSTCKGCELSFLRIGESLLDVLPEITFVQSPIFPDDGTVRPRATVGFVFGAVRHENDLTRLQQLRDRVDVLLAIGTCAVVGGLPALCDAPGVNFAGRLAERVCTVPGPEPLEKYQLLPTCAPVADYVQVDLNVPGCPPHPDWLVECLLALVDARTPRLPGRCVCDACPTRRSGTPPLNDTVFRMLDQPDSPPRNQLADMLCLLEQGFMCMGPLTRSGCGGKDGTPQCIAAGVPCRGCYGPVNRNGQALADYVSALAAAGYDISTMPDKVGFLSRYTGFRMLDLYRRSDHE